MSRFDPVPLDSPLHARIVVFGERAQSNESSGAGAKGVETEVRSVPIVRHAPSVRKYGITLFKSGTRLRLKEGMGYKKDLGVIFVVESHTIIGIKFRGKKGIFPTDHFERVR